MSSRRESRASSAARNTDALQEFETARKKFLMVNKHIARQNATLNIEKEELRGQLTQLFKENLRLRASEIALNRQLKEEKDVCVNIIEEADKATSYAMQQLGNLRQLLTTIARGAANSFPKSYPPAPRPSVSTPAARVPLSKQPDISFIHEGEEEDTPSSPPQPCVSVRPPRDPLPGELTPQQANLSVAQLPSPPSPPEPRSTGRRRPARRQSGLLAPVAARSPSPSPPVSDAEAEDSPSPAPEDTEPVVVAAVKTSMKKGTKTKSKVIENVDDKMPPAGLLDVTNASPRRPAPSVKKKPALSVLDEEESDAPRPKTISPTAQAPAATASSSGNTRLRAFAQAPAVTPTTTKEPEVEGGRERRSRRSVNYAEPKLNTKMRKPDPAPSSTSTAPRLPPSTTLSSNSLTPLANDTAGINPGATSSTSVGTTRKRKPVAQDRSDNEDYEPAAPVDKVASGSHKGVADYATGGLWAASYQSTQSKLKQNKSKPSPAATIPPLQPETDPSSRRRRPLPGSQGSHDRPRYVFADSDDDDDGDGDGAEEEDEYIPSTARRKSSGPGKAVGTGPPAPNSVRDGSDRRHSLAT